ncbi:helix-turn-helix domain-containing protein [Streptomyces sediminimaris]|uniref:helix-turn-helix domain-containing protein n=1 Tax=Streptomyces sediminimaris TaxID=3383721 RepID=UPI00399B82DE
MDTQNPSAPPRAQSRVAGNNHPRRQAVARAGGLIHDNRRHTARFTVIGNHLAQHAELSLVAIGLACHIQSLPKGARVDIKTLTARFQEGSTRIAAALRELEAHGYLRRERERAPSGRIVTRTISCNQPGKRVDLDDASHDYAPSHSTSAVQGAPRKKKPLPAVPQPVCTVPAPLQQATDLLSDLRRHDPRLLLSACDIAHLAPGVAAWLERDVTPAAVRHALTADLPPEGPRRPAALLAHRLAAQLPPLPPLRAPAVPPTVRHPFQNCDGCDRAFRSPTPGRCHDCRTSVATATGCSGRGTLLRAP